MTGVQPDLMQELGHHFYELMERIPWLKPTEDLYVTELEAGTGIDIAAQLDVPGGGQVLLLVDVRESIRPSEVKSLVSRLREKAQDGKLHESLGRFGFSSQNIHTHLVLASRWLSPRTAQRIAMEEGVGWFDLVGNVHIEFPGVYLHAEGIANPFESKERTISWSSLHAQGVLRELLDPPNTGRCWRQRELAAECLPKVSLGTVNLVAKRLVDSAYAEETGRGLRLTDPVGLLRDWGDNYRPIYQATRSYYTTLHGEALQKRLQDLFSTNRSAPPDKTSDIALAGPAAAAWFAPFLRSSSLCCYANPGGERVLRDALELKPAESGANVVLWITSRSSAFRHRIDLPNGTTTTSLVQTYLDLRTIGERGSEAADHLLTQKLQPLWNEWRTKGS